MKEVITELLATLLADQEGSMVWIEIQEKSSQHSSQ